MPDRQDASKIVIAIDGDGCVDVVDYQRIGAAPAAAPAAAPSAEGSGGSGGRRSSVEAPLRRVVVELVGAEAAAGSWRYSSSNDTSMLHLRRGLSSASVLQPQGWWRKQPDSALVFVHGFIGHATCLKAFGQFLNLARLPNHIHPVAFVWPSGEGLVNMRDGVCAYAKTRDSACADAMLICFVDFLQGSVPGD